MEGYWTGVAIGAVVGAGIAAGTVLLAYHFSKPAIARAVGPAVAQRLVTDPNLSRIIPPQAVAAVQAIAGESITIALERGLPL